jgi:thiamine-phosphate pyrophosphorylase
MTARQTILPRLWLMTDERLGEALWDAVDRLPGGQAGVVFRHHSTDESLRRTMGRKLADLCRKRNLTLAVSRDTALARQVAADLVHNPLSPSGPMAFSRAVHSFADAIAARDEGAALAFVSPVFATRSHPGQEPLGIEAAIVIARAFGGPAIALGGMDAERFAPFKGAFHGWAGIDAWLKAERR